MCRCWDYLELCLVSILSRLNFCLKQSLHCPLHLSGWDLSVPTDQPLQHSIVDERILILEFVILRECIAHTP